VRHTPSLAAPEAHPHYHLSCPISSQHNIPEREILSELSHSCGALP